MEYRLSFAMQSAGLFLMTGGEFIAIYFLFNRFGSLRGWQLPEVAVLYGLINTAFAISEAFARGFDTFDELIRRGDFDRLLLRPRGTVFQVIAREVQLMRVGRLLQGVVILLWGMVALGTHWTLGTLVFVGWILLGGVCLFSALFVLQATFAFHTIEGLELLNVLTYGGVEVSEYPMSIYRPGFRLFFTFVIPLACVGYLPGLSLLNRGGNGFSASLVAVAPLAGVAFLAVSLQIWNWGVRRYTSTGS
jgi:ABC-2 type transport system permease protein